MTNDKVTAGPAFAAPSPLSTKIPAPTIAPMPSKVRSQALSARLSPVSRSAPDSIGFLRSRAVVSEVRLFTSAGLIFETKKALNQSALDFSKGQNIETEFALLLISATLFPLD